MNILSLTEGRISAKLFAGITIMSLLVSALPVSFFVAEATSPSPSVMFSDGFESDDFSEWIVPSGSDWETIDNTAGAQEGDVRAQVSTTSAGATLLRAGFPTVGFENIKLSFYYQLDDLESGEMVTLRATPGSVPTVNETVAEFTDGDGDATADWTLVEIDLAPEMDDQISVLIQFNAFFDSAEVFKLDNFVVTGTLIAEPKTEVEIDVFGDSAAGENQPGWLFNRDPRTKTPFEFNTDESVLGDGALYVPPITNTYDGAFTDCNSNPSDPIGNCDKFIGELFINTPLDEITYVSYDYQLESSVPAGKANEFYANAYVNFDDSNNFGHCVYNIVPTDGTSGWHTATFDPTLSYDVRTRSSAPSTCPSIPADLPDTAELRMFAINIGDTSASDQDVGGYFDSVIVETLDTITTYDFEPTPPDEIDPVIVVDSPADGIIVGSDFDITVTATDDVALDNVVVNLKTGTGGHIGTCLNESTGGVTEYTATCTVDVSVLAEGTYQFRTNTRDLAGNLSNTISQDFIVDKTGPVIVVDSPVDNFITGSDFDIEVTATDDNAVGQVVINIKDESGGHLGTCLNEVADGSAVYSTSCTVALEDWADGTYQFKTNARDTAGNLSNTVTQTYTINTNRPTIVVNDPVGVITTAEDFDIEVTATDDTGVAQVVINVKDEFGGHLGTCLNEVADDSTEYTTSCTLDITDLDDGTYNFRTNARDTAGNLSNTINQQFIIDRNPGSTITMCKYDEQDNALSGWTLMLLGDDVEEYEVPANSAAGIDTSPLQGGQSYVVIAEGTWENNRSPVNIVDAEYSTEDNWISSIMDGFTGFGTEILELFVDGNGGDWGAYNSLHHYAQAFTPANTGPVTLAINDSNHSDNTGSLDVSVGTGYVGVTGENGCVTFEEVPYGEYEVAELMQPGFENTSGLGLVTVDSETESFDVVNNDLSFIPPCELTIVSDDRTVVVENNEFATSTYEHGNWTASIPDANWIWESYRVIDPEIDTVLTFEETFTVDTPTSATLDVAADNGYKVFVNGELVVDRSSYSNNFQTHTQKTFTSEILAELVSGENTLRIEVINTGVEGSNDRGNPAGLLYKLVVNAENSCEVTTDIATSDLVITSPVANDEVLPATYTFAATYDDFDEDEDEVFWAIRAETCNGTDMIGNTPVSPYGTSTFDALTGEFEATVDMSSFASGNYCLVVNPREDAGAPEERATRTFILDNQTIIDPTTFTISGVKWDDKNGDGIIDENESTLSGWDIFVSEADSESDAILVTTGADGSYSLEVSAGTWVVTEDLVTGWTQTGQYQNGELVTSDSEDFGACTLTVPGDDVPQTVYTCSFGNQQDTQVSVIDDNEPSDTGSVSGSSGTRIERVAQPEPLVLGVTTDAPQLCPFLTEHMQIGSVNSTLEVMKLQAFLNIFKDMFGGVDNPITGTFGTVTDANVKAFQEEYRSEVLDPWFEAGLTTSNEPTGFVYLTTKWKINDILCPGQEQFPDLETENQDSETDLD